ncbi:MAG: M23 family metallopeptidase [Gemmatimonadaceae bacterium]
MRRRFPTVVLTLALAVAAARRAGGQLPPSVEMRVPKPPAVATGAGASFLAYELHITNLSAAALTLRRVEVLSPGGAGGEGRVLLALDDSALTRALTRPGVSPAPAPADRSRIGGGLRAVVFLWVPVDGRTPPARIRHRLTLAQGSGDSVRTHELEGAATSVTADAVVIGPPLRGGAWLAGNGPDSLSGHRRALIAAEGTPTIAQRFAIDWLIVDDSGRTFVGDRLKNESYYAEGKEAIAVADGVVAATKDGIPENVPGINSRAVPITLETVGGNHVILDIGGGHYAFYAHLKPGSLRVRTGDRVRRGQVVGLVGNSGNSTEPHLHFHVMDGTSPLGSEGVPYRYTAFDLVGRCRRLIEGCARTAPDTRRRETPMANMIVRFPN